MKKGGILARPALLATVFLLFALACSRASAVTITPVSASIPSPQPGEEYNFIITLINDEPSDISAELVVDPKSSYLQPYVAISPKSFTLAPNEKINIEVTLKIPNSITPEEHKLYLVPVSSGKRWPAFEIYFTIPGEQVHNLTLKKLSASDAGGRENVYVTLDLYNSGNVIARAVPHMEILKGDSIVDVVEGKNEIIILPGKEYNMTLLYDPRGLSFGFYKIRVYFTYNGWRMTNALEDSFQVMKYSELDSFRNTSEVKIFEGEALQVEMAILYQKRTAYKLKAGVEGTEISIEQEGILEAEEQKILSFELPTETLERGTYTVRATVTYGEDFSQKAEKILTLTVKARHSKIKTAAIALSAVLLLAFLTKKLIFPIKEETGAAGFRQRKSLRRRMLEKKLRRAEKRYVRLEAEIRNLINSTQAFINESNDFLRKKTGGKCEFR